MRVNAEFKPDAATADGAPDTPFSACAWLVITLGLAHLGAALSAPLLESGRSLVVIAAADGLVVVLAAALSSLTWVGRIRLNDVTLAAVIAAAAGAGTLRAVVTGSPLVAADLVFAVIGTALLTQRRTAVLTLTGTTLLGGLGLAVALTSPRATEGPRAGANWALMSLLLLIAAGVAAVLRRMITELVAARAAALSAAIDLSVVDSLTGAANRRGMELIALPMIEHARRQGEAVHCLFLDLDEFHDVNERAGRPTGDRVLTAVAAAVQASARGTDVVVRWAGDQFLVIGPGTGTSPLEMERRVRSHLSTGPVVAEDIWSGRVSVGSSTLVPWDESNLDSLLIRAEQDMILRRSLRRPEVHRGAPVVATKDRRVRRDR